jgi:hypothetical protein
MWYLKFESDSLECKCVILSLVQSLDSVQGNMLRLKWPYFVFVITKWSWIKQGQNSPFVDVFVRMKNGIFTQIWQ